MYQEKCMEYAGMLDQEVREVKEVVIENREAEIATSLTSQCSQVLTIFCC